MSESVTTKKKKKTPLKQSIAALSSEVDETAVDDDPRTLDILRELADIKGKLGSILKSQAKMQESMTINSAKPAHSVEKAKAAPASRIPEKESEQKPAAEDVLQGDASNATSEKEILLRPTAMKAMESERDELVSKKYLQDTFELAEEVQDRNRELDDVKSQGFGAYVKYKWAKRTKEEAEILLDSAMGWVISVNAVYIGMAMDMESSDEPIWLVINLVFSAIFVAELILKVTVEGPKKYFSKGADIFDTCLVLVDLLQLILDQTTDVTQNSDVPSASLFRLIRLAKLTRLLRLLRSDVFKDLLAMIQGMIGGMSTLMWAQILFLLCVYVVALLFRELLGRDKVENVDEYFNAVPRSIFTTFRCSFGDCSAKGGVPIFEYVYDAYSGWMTVLYCLFTFATVIGLFNVVSAIFVETTMSAAAKMAKDKREKRLADPELWSSSIAIVIRKIIQKLSGQDEELLDTDKLSEQIDEIIDMNVPNKILDDLIEDKDVETALLNLGIDPDDNKKLSDILDPDNGGRVNLNDLINGINRLRGEPKRSDIVAIDMMVRATQLKIDEVLHWMSVKDENAFHAKANHQHEHHHNEPAEIPHMHLHHNKDADQGAPSGEDLRGIEEIVS